MTAGVCLDIIGMDGVIVVEVEVQKFLSVYLSSYLSIYLSIYGCVSLGGSGLEFVIQDHTDYGA